MKLPKKITPSPLVSSVVELRFKSKKSSNEVFKVLLAEFEDEFPDFENVGLSPEMKKEKGDLKYFPDYIFFNEHYSMAFSDSFINFENISEYKLWDEYSNFIKSLLERIEKLEIIGELDRVGIRYGSIFEDIDSISTILNIVPAFNIEGFEENLVLHTSEHKSGEAKLFLRVRQDFEGNDPKGNFRKGHLIDIDASMQKNIECNEIFEKIEILHKLIKKLFFGLLKDDFVKSLKPEY